MIAEVAASVLAEATAGRQLSAAVLNAGITHFGHYYELPWAEFQTMLRISEILSAWYQEPAFLYENGEPRSLPLVGAKSFATLVTRFLPRFKPDDIAEVLIAERVLRRGAQGELTPLRRTVSFTKPGAMMLDRVPVVLQCLLSTIRHNVTTQGHRGTRCERLITLDRLPVAAIPAFNEQVKKLAQSLSNQMENWANPRQLPEGSKTRSARSGGTPGPLSATITS